MITEEILKAILAGREYRRESSDNPWMKFTPDPTGLVYGFDLNGRYELRPLAPVFDHWHMLPGWCNAAIAMNRFGEWQACASAGAHVCGDLWTDGDGNRLVIIPSQLCPQWTGDWRDSKIANPTAPGVWVTRDQIGRAWDQHVAGEGDLNAAPVSGNFKLFVKELGL